MSAPRTEPPTEGAPRAACALATQTPRITRAHPDQRLTTAHTGHVRRTGTKSGTNLDAVSFVGRSPVAPALALHRLGDVERVSDRLAKRKVAPVDIRSVLRLSRNGSDLLGDLLVRHRSHLLDGSVSGT
jgi:hypothetical protein